mmetsp:Transcript_24282/g.54586  ORF Transcript_24282/g.54586 Transcript_24282/m.54586 type:complete len:176 (+) Transcript_24282:308-835(+)
MGFEDELGVLPPVGFFDPLGLSNTIDQSRFDRWRAVEIKHGRVSMAAVTGLVAAELGRWPGYIAPGENLKFADVPNGIAALGSIPFLGWAQIILFVGWLETAVFIQKEDKAPGDFGTGYFTEYGRIGPLSGEKKAEKLTKELQNGRLAMLAVAGIVAQELTDGKEILCHFQKVCA